MKLNEKLRKLRMDKGLSVYKLSRLTEISENHIHSIERGKSQPSIAILEKLLYHLDTNLPEFLLDKENLVCVSASEQDLLRIFRSLQPIEKKYFLQFMLLIENRR